MAAVLVGDNGHNSSQGWRSKQAQEAYKPVEPEQHKATDHLADTHHQKHSLVDKWNDIREEAV